MVFKLTKYASYGGKQLEGWHKDRKLINKETQIHIQEHLPSKKLETFDIYIEHLKV
jgi:hypothetical protein